MTIGEAAMTMQKNVIASADILYRGVAISFNILQDLKLDCFVGPDGTFSQ